MSAEKNSGGGAGGGGKTTGGGTNPFAKESLNVTEQMRITKENPDLANRLKQEAGAAS